MKKITTVTVGIPAYNEEQNIEFLLKSIIKQEQLTYKIEEVLVVSDGSDDMTDKKVKGFSKRYPWVNLYSDGSRKGQTLRLNELYKRNKSDLIITFDGDVVLGDNQVIEEMVRCFSNSKVLVVAAKQVGVFESNFLGRIFQAAQDLWDRTRESVPNSVSVHNLMGAASALRKDFARSLKYPSNISCNQNYLFVEAYKKNGFKYASKAIVYYRSFASIRDFRLQSTRAMTERYALTGIFGESVLQLYEVPEMSKVNALAVSLFRNPFYTMLVLALWVWLRLNLEKKSIHNQAIWEVVKSTKKPIKI